MHPQAPDFTPSTRPLVLAVVRASLVLHRLVMKLEEQDKTRNQLVEQVVQNEVETRGRVRIVSFSRMHSGSMFGTA
jgi:hypothetical protein